MKNLFRSIVLGSVLALSLNTKPVNAAIGIASTGPAAVIFLVGGATGGFFLAISPPTYYHPGITQNQLIGLGSLILLDNAEDKLIESLKNKYPFLDRSTSKSLAGIINEKVEIQGNSLEDESEIILDINKDEIAQLLEVTDLLDSEMDLIINDFSK